MRLAQFLLLSGIDDLFRFLKSEVFMKGTTRFNKAERNDIISIYLKDISRFPLLSAEEEKECVTLSQKGDMKAREKLINSNLRFVVKIAKKYRNKGIPFADLISEGNIGLAIAAERFDVKKNVRFISYAVWWIKQTILKAISEKSHLIRLPVNRMNELSQIEDVLHSQKNKNIEEVAGNMNIERDVLTSMLNVSHRPLSFDEPINNDNKEGTIEQTIKDNSFTPPETEAINAVLKDDIAKMLSSLSNREAAIIKYRFGLSGEEPHSLIEVGMQFNLTKERIRQIEKKSIEKLKTWAEKHNIESYCVA